MSKYGICKKCGKEAVHLAMASPEFIGDGDDREGNPSKYESEGIYSEDVSIGTHICFKCNEVEDVFIETPRDKEVRHVVIDGIQYVPAGTVVVNAHTVLKTLVEQYMGITDNERVDQLSDELWIVITENPEGYNEPPTIKEIVERMAL